ncbi:MAG: hypothetical protein ACT4QC_15065 [Planctomycetaceae bacterium]
MPAGKRGFERGRWLPARVLLLIATIAFAAIERPAVAQQSDETDPNVPLLIVNVASVERLLNQAVSTFEAAGRPELSEMLGGALERVNDLKGLDRNLSTGVMLFLNGLSPELVTYVPVKDVGELAKTAEIGPITTKKTGEDRYELVGGRQTLYVKLVNDYAFVADSAAGVDRKFRDPVRMTGRLSSSYDVAVSLNLRSITPLTRDLFLGMFRASTENGLQRRDDEPEGAYRVRRAAGNRNLEVIEQLVKEGEELTIGWSLSPTGRSGALEIVASAMRDSEYANYLNELKGTHSHFANLLKEGSPLIASLSWKLDRSAKKMLRDMLAGIATDLGRNLNVASDSAEAAGEGPANPVAQLVAVLQKTAEIGHLDFAAQYLGRPPGPFVLLAALKVADDGQLAGALADIVGRLNNMRALSKVRENDFSHEGVTFHRVEFANFPEDRQRLYGENPGLYFGAGSGVLWVALGGDEAAGELKRGIDALAKPVPESVTTPPLQVVMNFSSWMDMFDPTHREGGIAELARRSFSKGGDALRIEAIPVPDGLRIRVNLDEAFLRLLGQSIARRLDRAQEGEVDGPDAP